MPSASLRAPSWLRAIFIANLVAQIGIIVTGGVVRLTGSGLGCPTWPECVDGSYVPVPHQAQEWHKYVEFGNRLLTFVLGVLAIAAILGALLWAWQRRRAHRPGRPALIWLAAIPLVGTVAQAVLGGITVLTGLSPWVVAAHFLLSMVIIAGCTLLVVRSGEPGDRPVRPLARPEVRWMSRLLILVTGIVVTLGTIVTGSGPHSGDAATELRIGIDPRLISWLHADVVLLFLGLTIGMLVVLHVVDGPSRARRYAWLLLAVSVIQGILGYTQYFTGLPWLIVTIHMLGSALVWMLSILLLLSLRTRGPVD